MNKLITYSCTETQLKIYRSEEKYVKISSYE